MYKAAKLTIQEVTILLLFIMSDPSQSVSETTIINACSNMNINKNVAGNDTPLPSNKLSNETLAMLEEARDQLNSRDLQEASTSTKKRPRSRSPSNPANKSRKYMVREEYPEASKAKYLSLKNLTRKKVTMSANIKTMEAKLAKKEYPSAVNFRFNINATRDPKLRECWSTIIHSCKADLTKAMIDDMYRKYNQLKSQIAKEYCELEEILNPEQFHEIRRTLEDKSKGMAPVILQKKEKQYRFQRPKAKPKRQFKPRQREDRKQDKPKDQKLMALFNSLKDIMNN